MEQNLNLSEVFSQRVFRIPDYQRGYAWTDKELLEFWDDLEEISDLNGNLKRHYTGTLFLEEIPPSPEENWLPSKFYNIIDGQQRLTTIIILIFELLNRTENGYCGRGTDKLRELFIAEKNNAGKNKVYKLRYHDTNKINTFLLTVIFENDKKVLDTDSENHYTKNLENAKNFFQEKIIELNEAEKDLLFRKITTSLIFDLRTIEKEKEKGIDVQAVFETMNNRGKQLTILEKLKNRLIYLTENHISVESDKNILRDQINNAWGNIYISLAQEREDPLDEDEFLSAHLSLYEKPQEGYFFSKESAEKKLFQMFCNKPEKHGEEPITYEKIENYIVNLSKLAPIWDEVHHSDNIALRKILLLYKNREVKILLAALLFKNRNRENLNRIFILLERLFFRNSVPGIYLINIQSEPAIKAREIYKNNELVKFDNYLEEKLKVEINPQYVLANFKNLFTYVNKNVGFHRWGALKYFLFVYYEDKLQEKIEGNNKKEFKKVSLANFDRTQIEHILPKSWQEHWTTEMDEYLEAFGEIEELTKYHVIKVLINSLGNLTILLDEKNLELSNDPWSIKKGRYTTGSYNEIEISNYTQWTYKSIQQRGEEMLRFLCEKIKDNFSLDEKTTREILFDSDYIIARIYG